ncbi:MAG: EFR1 family ferrodoxin [Clostridia bacterium]|nr:EFR1 family ferrodoxin [Clostridia bacterium]
MIGILYFSSTGNSLYIAQQIKDSLGGKIIYIPNYNGDGSECEKVIVVSPIYSFGLPIHTYDLLPKLKNVPVYIVLNYGGMTGGADYFSYKYCLQSGVDIKAVYTVKMPENYTLFMSVPKAYIKSTLCSAPKRIARVTEQLKSGRENIPRARKTKEQIFLNNKDNWHKIADDFSVADDCVKCGLCAKICPTDNISLSGGKPVFGDSCVACLGCYHRCPQRAILYKNRTKTARYINPDVNPADIGKDL